MGSLPGEQPSEQKRPFIKRGRERLSQENKGYWEEISNLSAMLPCMVFGNWLMVFSFKINIPHLLSHV